MKRVDPDKMLKEIGNTKFNEWIAFYTIVQEDEEKAIEDAKKK
jgi:hypothetical protein